MKADDLFEETLANGVLANRDELLRYGLSEEIIYFKRRWFVLPDDASAVLSRVLLHRKPVTSC